jgi:hypothetical protein
MATTKAMTSEKAALQALDKISGAEARLNKVLTTSAMRRKGMAAKELALEDFDLKKICKEYSAIKQWVMMALPLVEAIPVYGKKIANALRMVMKVADVVCEMA